MTQYKMWLNFTAAGFYQKLYYAIVKLKITRSGEYLTSQEVADRNMKEISLSLLFQSDTCTLFVTINQLF